MSAIDRRVDPNQDGNFEDQMIEVRFNGKPIVVPKNQVDFIDSASNQAFSIATSMIPFLNHDDSARALMGSNMQRQAVPLLKPEAPIVGTGMEQKLARDSRALIIAEGNGKVEYVDANKIIVNYDINLNSVEYLTSFDDSHSVEYALTKFRGTNQETCINQIPIVKEGQKITEGEVLADGSATEGGEIALGRNVLVAFMPWRGYNFEDAIIINEKIVANDTYTSINIEEFELQVRETKRGEEELTMEIPNVSEEAVKDLDENGIIREGAQVKGFTLIEILIVVAIIAILALAILPNYIGFDIEARAVTTKTNLSTLRNRIALFRAKEGRYPESLSDLLEETYSDVGIEKPYLRKMPAELVTDKSGNAEFKDQKSSQAFSNKGGWLYLTDKADVVINYDQKLDKTWEDYEGQNPAEW